MAVLEVQNITKKFSGVTALDSVSLKLQPGTVTALIGENGAGKSTLLKIMSGIYTDFEGAISFKEEDVRFSSPKDAQDAGISIIHQELNLIPHMTVRENIFLGREVANSFGFIDKPSMNKKCLDLLKKLKLEVDPEALVSTLKVGQQQVIEIAKALLTDSEVLFMDEPTSAIGEEEVEVLFDIIHQLKAEGKAIVYISHKLDELFTIADDFVVLRDGQLIGQGQMADVSRDQLLEMMAGRKVELISKAKRAISEKVQLTVENLTLTNPENPNRPILKDISFEIKQGEVLGIYGLMGAGRTELCECLFGLHSKLLSGAIELENESVNFKSPVDAINSGLALVPEDRKQDGIVPEMSVAQNLSLGSLNNVLKLGLLSKSKESKLYDKHVEALKIKVQSESQLIQNLSGGNQQKVILGKWIERNPKVLMLDEPTRGIDVNAKNEIYKIIEQLSADGISVLVVSSEIPEIMSVSDRILVMAEGRIMAEFKSGEADENKIISACIPERLN